MSEVYTEPGANGRANPAVDLHRPLGVGETRRLTDLGNAERFADRHKRHARYCFAWGKWLIFDGKRWAVDDDGNAEQLMQETVRNIYNEAAGETDDTRRRTLADHARRSEARARITDALHLARPFLSVRPEELDADPHLLNCENGTVDLRTGKRRDHDIEDMLTKIAAPCDDLLAKPPVFCAFLEKILPTADLRNFVQATIGYAAIGSNAEQILPIFHGSGANGKSTLVNALMEALGDYAMQAAPDLLIAKKDAHPTELADLFGARFVASVETDDGRRLNEALVKQLTGGDPIKARKMRQDFWEFDPTHTVFLATNHKPEVRGTDHAIWRRLKLVPFDVTIPDAEQDKKLPEKLRKELPAILSWIVRGALMYQQLGLPEPAEVKAATATYRDDMDALAAFLEDRCVVHPRAEAPATPLYNVYQEWCAASGEASESQRRFGGRLKERGFESFTYTAGPHRDRKGWRGIGIRNNRHDDPGGPESSARADERTRANGSNPVHEANKATESADKGPQSGQTADDRPHTQSRIGMGEIPDLTDSAEDHGPNFGINSPMGIREEVMPKKGPQGPHRPQPVAVTPREGRVSAEQTERVKRLIAEGMAPDWARAEVLGNRAEGEGQ